MRRVGPRSFWIQLAATFIASVALLVVVQAARAVADLGVSLSDALVVVAAVVVGFGVVQLWRAWRRRRAEAAEQAAQSERRMAILERHNADQAEQIGKLEAAVIGDVARAAVAEGWTVQRAAEKDWGPGWFEFRAADGSDGLIISIHPESELVATIRERGLLRLEGLSNGYSDGDWSAAALWPKSTD